MTESKRGIATNLKALDAHVIKPEEYEDIPEWTDEELARADLHEGGKLIRRGRPPSPETRKQPVKIRLDREVAEALRASGPGWQTRLNALLRDVLGPKDVRGVRGTRLARELKRELLGAKGIRTALPASKAPRAPKVPRVPKLAVKAPPKKARA
jgi:uncharacterized protein (DUF4415 family)